MAQIKYRAVVTNDASVPAEESQIITLETLNQYKLLALAVIKQAAIDAPRYLRAQQWLTGDIDAIALRWWCEIAGVNPYQLKNRCITMLEAGK